MRASTSLWILLLATLAGCGRWGVELVTFAEQNICVFGSCSNEVDLCPDDAKKMNPGICGCGVSDDADQDSDGTPDCTDMCPSKSDRASGSSCGCDASNGDADGDALVNCRDFCPFDVAKQMPLVCGCGIADTDSDGDKMPDCADECPDDATKVVAGKCGCGVPENSRDVDKDGKLDCVDLCNGVDDARYVPITRCGIGFCSTNTTASSCSNGVETDCKPGPPKSTTDSNCDGVDDDCDGAADEDYPAQSTMCGIGACMAAGTKTCANGAEVDSCMAKNKAVNDMSCDGIDDDCDGTKDEDFSPRASTCGNGLCASTGTVTCGPGAELDSCRPDTSKMASDANCNGIDENCDGVNDDGYVQTPTSCGTGACATTGALRCVNGAVEDSCKPGTMAANDPTCDGVDDDCDGTKDENYVPVPSSCGTGACMRTGTVVCTGGVPTDTCKPAAPAANDTTCNGIDEDCNGQVDEDYVVPTSTCGLGVCQRTGVINCVGGKTQNTCVAGTTSVTTDGPPANGLDDDCDGQVDEDACVDHTPRTFSVGTYNNIAVPAGCLTANVRLWGGGGGSGDETSVGGTGNPGRGGSGGYVAAAVAIPTTQTLNLYVGNGGAGCGSGGTNAGSSSYNGGAGAASGVTKAGTDGQDGVVSGGGAGGNVSAGDGGRGYYGGGGGGSGLLAPWPPYPGGGGGGGAATVVLVGSTRAAVAGGGGGGGGTNGSSVSSTGGVGGEGCSGAGGAAGAGGGGGGGVCIGAGTQGANGVPAFKTDIPNGRATGGTGICGAGGGGYAIITFSR
jgi:hypothetical protein